MSRIPLPSSPSIQLNGTPNSKDTSTGSTMSSSSSSSYLNSPSSRVGAGAGTRASSSDAGLADTRKRVSKKDEAIRKKIESELNRKRPGAKRSQRSQHGSNGAGGGTMSRPKPGTVSALRPLPALTVPHSISVSDASQLCAAKRTDCVLVVDEEEHLCGIFSAKDLAFRVVGEGLDPRNTPVSAIMTPNPIVTRDSTSATEALETMNARHFRHLPVCNEDGDVVGLLDITKVFHASLEKLEKQAGTSDALAAAVEGAQEQFGGASNPILAYIQALRDRTKSSDLGSILDPRTLSATVGVKTTVREAARLMRELRTTAVCVMEEGGRKIAGIFTSKDVVLRVIAAGLDPKTCSVVRVMTPHPDVALPTYSIQDGLRKMLDGRYLNLPIVDDEGSLLGIVDVLKLTYATIEQLNSMEAENGADSGNGPLWGRFFGAAADIQDDDTESMVSAAGISESPSQQFQTPVRPGHRSHNSMDTPGSELFPNDSASAVGDGNSDVGRRGPGQASSIGAATAASAIADDGTYLFKFVAPGGTTHRFQARYDSHEFITDIIAEEGVVQTPSADPRDFKLSYTDDDGDLVLMTADRDVQDAVSAARKQGKDRVVVHLTGGKGWDEELARRAAVQQLNTTSQKVKKASPLGALDEVTEDDAEETVVEDEDEAAASAAALKRKQKKKVAPSGGDELVFGFLPKDLLLPASIGFLGIVIVGVFAASKAGGPAAGR
ncbi:BZ3500_MvSof-1268-A1-R1_Chr5-2g07786 [Microbotryum saponariae]|uniref:BZ3500_MvSof-1268-A1-R1_Chr5-2g07786 protein n=1 Tax=Microbotryum saponariae TaxID=289078 RepID=A0A2X0KI44_9BASI|nr:BZ3500_MvSof-1268-A1-R1_Chr5-2g07786 [Microbotryum saponariae]SDA05655.1 BZ3501_MvSof-1269-A2-R1_Chr5-2g07608 [Microbotryum saponariae]